MAGRNKKSEALTKTVVGHMSAEELGQAIDPYVPTNINGANCVDLLQWMQAYFHLTYSIRVTLKNASCTIKHKSRKIEGVAKSHEVALAVWRAAIFLLKEDGQMALK